MTFKSCKSSICNVFLGVVLSSGSSWKRKVARLHGLVRFIYKTGTVIHFRGNISSIYYQILYTLFSTSRGSFIFFPRSAPTGSHQEHKSLSFRLVFVAVVVISHVQLVPVLVD
jgi:hypothetical protein